jgi:acyl-CoA thioesterase-1
MIHSRGLVLSTALISTCGPTNATNEQAMLASEDSGTDSLESNTTESDTTESDTADSGTEGGEGGHGENHCILDVEGCAGICSDDNPDALRILPLGDSVTRGRDQYPSYRYYLGELLAQAGHSINFVGTLQGAGGCCNNGQSYDPQLFPAFCDLDHEGHGGYEASEAVELVTQWTWEDAGLGAVDLALVMLGTVDAMHETPLDVTMSSMFELIVLLQQRYPGVRIAIATPIPVSNPDMQAAIVAIAEALPELASLSSPAHEVVIVDMHEGFDIDTMLTPDGAHGNALGDAFMAQRWFDAISAELGG